LLELILEKKLLSETDACFYYAQSVYMQRKLVGNSQLTLTKWKLHQEVYLGELRRRLEGCRGGDAGVLGRLRCSAVWTLPFLAWIFFEVADDGHALKADEEVHRCNGR
jgi:hypothetical protein